MSDYFNENTPDDSGEYSDSYSEFGSHGFHLEDEDEEDF